MLTQILVGIIAVLVIFGAVMFCYCRHCLFEKERMARECKYLQSLNEKYQVVIEKHITKDKS